jgi:phosphoribosyl 1,2-cyclic phosphate phosphodiesterase
VLVLDCLRFREHPTHLWVDRALEYIAQIKPRRTFFTHIAHDIKHGRDSARLPSGVEFAYDGLVVEPLPISDCQLPIEKGTGGS